MGRGLRFKFNATLLPIVAATVIALGWVDAEHERDAVMAAHAVHGVGSSSPVVDDVVDGATSPQIVARRSVAMHAAYAATLLLLVGVGLNAALSRLVLAPIDRIQDGIDKMERGHWRLPPQPAASDEVGRMVDSFQRLGLSVDAIVQQTLRAERLATLALVAKKAAGQIEPRIERIAAAAAGLQVLRDPAARDAGHTITSASAEILAAVRGLDRLFDASLHLGSSSSRSHATASHDHVMEAAPVRSPVERGAGSP